MINVLILRKQITQCCPALSVIFSAKLYINLHHSRRFASFTFTSNSDFSLLGGFDSITRIFIPCTDRTCIFKWHDPLFDYKADAFIVSQPFNSREISFSVEQRCSIPVTLFRNASETISTDIVVSMSVPSLVKISLKRPIANIQIEQTRIGRERSFNTLIATSPIYGVDRCTCEWRS